MLTVTKITDDQRAAIGDLIRNRGTKPAADSLGISREAMLRAFAGCPVRAGTVAIITARLAPPSASSPHDNA